MTPFLPGWESRWTLHAGAPWPSKPRLRWLTEPTLQIRMSLEPPHYELLAGLDVILETGQLSLDQSLRTAAFIRLLG